MFLFFGVVAVDRLVLRPGRAARAGRRSCWRCRSACSPRRSWWSTTCATSRPTGGRASGRWRCGSGRDARARAVRGDGLRARSSTAPIAVAARRHACRRGCCCRWLALPLAAPVVRIVRNAHRRAVAQRRARRRPGMLQLVFCVLLSAGHPRELMAELAGPRARCAARCARRCAAAWGDAARARAAAGPARVGDGADGEGEAAPLEPYDGVPLAAVRAALDAYAEVLASATPSADAAGGLPAPSATCRRRSRRSTSRCGTSRAARRAAGGAS